METVYDNYWYDDLNEEDLKRQLTECRLAIGKANVRIVNANTVAKHLEAQLAECQKQRDVAVEAFKAEAHARAMASEYYLQHDLGCSPSDGWPVVNHGDVRDAIVDARRLTKAALALCEPEK